MMKIGRFSARIGTILTAAGAASAMVGGAGSLGCGQVTLGGGTANDAVPVGTIVAQGSFTSVASGKPVTGTVTVYLASSIYIVRLQGLSTPSESGLFVRGVVNGIAAQDLALRSTSGNQNYTFSSVPAGSIWAQVKIYSATANLDYGLATLTQVASP
jgi:hypothetical protein